MKKRKEKKTDRILLVEDETSLRRGIRLNLEAEGYRVTDFSSASDALSGMESDEDYSLGIIDVMMPDEMDGLELCRRIRARNLHFPVIFLTARGRLEDKLEGFEAGGDDYMTKPFDLEELLARIKVRLRKKSRPSEIRIGSFLVDLKAGSAQEEKSGKVVRFNERELNILKLLVEHRGSPVSRDAILDSVWGTAEFPTNRTIDNYMVKFRKIFEPDPRQPRYIITRHGTGYELSEEGES